jgi:hypothetical protein
VPSKQLTSSGRQKGRGRERRGGEGGREGGRERGRGERDLELLVEGGREGGRERERPGAARGMAEQISANDPNPSKRNHNTSACTKTTGLA